MSGLGPRVESVEPISFARGIPAPECLPSPTSPTVRVRRSSATARRCSTTAPPGAMRRCVNGSPSVIESIRSRSCSRTARSRASTFSPTAWRRRGPVLVEAPTYDRPLKTLAALGAEVIPFRSTTTGLRRLARGDPPRGAAAFVSYTIPTFQNPRGRTLPGASARGSRLARAAGLLVFEDDPYGLVRFEGEAPPTVLRAREAARTSSTARPSRRRSRPGCGSATSSCPRGSRPRSSQPPTAAYITPALLSQATVYEFLRRGNLEPNLERVCALLRARRDAMVARSTEHFPEAAGPSRRAGTSSGSSSRGIETNGPTVQQAASRSCRARTSSPGGGGENASVSPSAMPRRRRSRKACALPRRRAALPAPPQLPPPAITWRQRDADRSSG